MIHTTALLMFAIVAAMLAAIAYTRRHWHETATPAASRRPGARRQTTAIARSRTDGEPVATPATTTPTQPASAKPAPDLVMLEWGEPGTAKDSVPLDGLRAKVRDRYIAARFPGVFHGSAQLLETERVIQTARHYFEQGKFDRAVELLSLAIEQVPGEKALRLAQIEIAYLARGASLFTRLARDFREAHPASAEWDDVARLGRAIAPTEELFGACPGTRAHEQYGPWPDMPNWIQAPWDLTSEVLASDFHRAMAAHAERHRRPQLRQAA